MLLDNETTTSFANHIFFINNTYIFISFFPLLIAVIEDVQHILQIKITYKLRL
jgi:hypothetical protein